LASDAAEWSGRTTFEDGMTDAAAWFTLDELESVPKAELVEFVLARIR
jgi:hypothetical protein